MSEIELAPAPATTNLTATMDYARAVSSAALLPDAYRGKPADIMLAVECFEHSPWSAQPSGSTPTRVRPAT